MRQSTASTHAPYLVCSLCMAPLSLLRTYGHRMRMPLLGFLRAPRVWLEAFVCVARGQPLSPSSGS